MKVFSTTVIVTVIASFLGISTLNINTNTFYYNHTDSGSEYGRLELNDYCLDILASGDFKHYEFKENHYDDIEQEYTYISVDNDTILFSPTERQLKVNSFTYYINSTIKSNW